ncbi:Alpha-ketoglutarate-dependent taurine dioxygenase [Comamonas aquatilis]|uniref:TauD/TfdA dioxygenase family protein n=1 Tax=Comamonas aquatilis TaxID=1778406 RepID=UPI0039EE6DCA
MPTATLTKKKAGATSAPQTALRSSFTIDPITPIIGAEIGNIDLGVELDEETFKQLRATLVKHKVLVFREQDITPAAQVAFARRFGVLETHPVFPKHPEHPELVVLGGDASKPAQENIYHSDYSWREEPSMASILRCIECPAHGGDTLWINMVAAYERLPESIKSRLAGLRAVHDLMPAFGGRMTAEKREATRRQYPMVEHPVVRTHPESGEKILYVNESFTTHFANFMENGEIRVGFDFRLAEMDLLQYLLRQAQIPEYQMRVRWKPNTIVMWDNRSTQHYAIQDYFPAVRRMLRATVIGDRTF